jgi:hypothetical protein
MIWIYSAKYTARTINLKPDVLISCRAALLKHEMNILLPANKKQFIILKNY